MPTIRSAGADIHYEVHGKGTPVLLLVGLGGVGTMWGPQVELFAKDHMVILPDHRGTGRSTRTIEGQTIEQHAADFARIVRGARCRPRALRRLVDRWRDHAGHGARLSPAGQDSDDRLVVGPRRSDSSAASSRRGDR